MKPKEKETKEKLIELSNAELIKTYGGSWWEIRYTDGQFVLIFHPYDDDMPK